MATDAFVDRFLAEEATRLTAQTVKGLLYIAITAALVYWLAKRGWSRVNLDLSELRRAEKALRESDASLRALIDASPQGITSLDLDGRVLTWNRSAQRLFGWRAEEVQGQLLPIVPEESLEEFSRLRARVANGERISGLEMRRRRKDGTLIDVSLSADPIPGDDGEVSGIIAVLEDITERKGRQVERDRLLMAMEQAQEAVLMTDAEGSIQYVNPSFERMTGYTRSEVEGKDPRILNSGEQDEEFYRSMWETLAAGETWHGRIVNRRKDGTHYTEEMSISPVRDRSGTLVSYVAVKRDVTRELALESQLRQAQKMESIGLLAGGLAHDFNNVLTVIQGHTELALADIDPDDPLRSDLQEIETAVAHSVELIRQLLSFARKQTVSPKVLDLNQRVASHLDFLARLIGEDVELRWQPGPNVWPIRMDPVQLEQALTNLLVNARDAIDGVGVVTIETFGVEVDEEHCADHPGSVSGDYTVLAVTDTGRGMDPETTSRIFEPFFTTKPQGEGTGLGLATVYGIVRQNEGFIDVESEPGQGSTFRLHLPRTQAEEPYSGPVPESFGAPSGSELVLLVEDEEALMNVATRFLQKLGYSVLAAGGPDEAIEHARRAIRPIDVILTDVVMPGMNGRELHSRLDQIQPGVRCVYMSGYTEDVIAHRGILEEDVLFLQKPFSLNELANALRQALDD